LKNYPGKYICRSLELKYEKLLFDFLRGFKLQKKMLAKSFGTCTNCQKLASKDVRCSQNRLFQLLPINFRYNRTSDKKSKKIILRVFLLAVGCSNPFANILFRSQMAATKPARCSKKIALIIPNTQNIFMLIFLFQWKLKSA
jgi:hypothetical protein